MGIVKIILPSAIIFKTFKNAPRCGFNSLQLERCAAAFGAIE